jgi:hypothetical protein
MQCSACNAAVSLGAGGRVGFRDECSQCRADLHTCGNCLHHDPNAYNECRESNSERVSERERANRCDYFSPAERQGGSDDSRQQGLSDLADLFDKK